MVAFDDTRECYEGRSIVLREGELSVEHTKQKITTFLMFDGKAEEEIDRLFEQLSQGGAVAMPLAAYPFSDKFAWVADKYGVSWQLNLERN